MQRKNGKSRAVEGLEGKEDWHKKELIGKRRGCAEEEWEE